MSRKARDAINGCHVIVGYRTYIKLLGELVAGKEVISFGMTEEVRRAKCAMKRALQGKRVCLISGGDPGIYGMAGLVLELMDSKNKKNFRIEIIPAVSSASACASLLGAPLMHDFAVISLSNLLTDDELIKKRVELAARADFIIVFYNPKSKRRTAPLKAAWKILMKYKSPETPVGIVRNAYRNGEEVEITNLKDMQKSEINMFTTIIVGNAGTYVKGGYMITPRGYKEL